MNRLQSTALVALAAALAACAQGGNGTDGGACSASSCASGCCAPNGTCISPANTDSACGSGGGTCAVCTGAQSCSSGVCTNGGNCNGCISGEACESGTTTSSCGKNGAACVACGQGQSCTNGACQGTCNPQCSGKSCGSDGCGGSCGTCSGGQSCNANGQCTSSGGGSIGNNGGSVPSLYFAVIGDTRPGSNNECGSYPTSIITKIYQDLEGLNPKPQFILTTGDYQFCDPGKKCSSGNTSEVCSTYNIGQYAQAASAFTGGPIFSAMGNHECNGYTDSNITIGSTTGTGTCDGTESTNYEDWFSSFVQPLGKTLPYYSIPITATDNSWTAKFIIVACNAWDSTQQTWLQNQLSQSTTYTFLVRHEDPTATTGPCVTQMDSMLSSATYTALIVGHVHQYCSGSLSSSTSCEYPFSSPKAFVVGNGGAVTSNDGYVTVQQNGSSFTVTDFDYSTNAQVASFTFQ